MSSAEPSSTSLPSYMTPIRSARYLTTARSCEIIMYAKSWDARSRFIRFSTCARIDTSSALTGSSATISRGFRARALARPMRCQPGVAAIHPLRRTPQPDPIRLARHQRLLG